MENQIEPDPINQPTPTPEKPRVKPWIYIFPIFIFGIVLGIGLDFLIRPNKIVLRNQTIQISPTITMSSEETGVPEKNTLYLGTYNGVDAIFLNGELLTASASGYSTFDFNNLQNPQKIFSTSKNIIGINSMRLNNSKSIAYVSLTYSPLINTLIQINLDTLTSSEIWANQVGSDKYKGGKGVVYLRSVADDKFLELSIGSCNDCDGGFAGTIILNINTQKEKYIMGIDNVRFNIANHTFSYQKLAPFEGPCNGDYGCDDGLMTVAKPSGKIFTENLP